MPLEGGAKMLVELRARARKYKSRTASVGFFNPEYASLALFMEFGFNNAATGHFVAPRPFFRLTIKNEKEKWAKRLLNQLKGSRGKNSTDAMKNVATLMRDDVKLYILSAFLYNPNKERTVKKKGFNRPLYETGRLSRKVTFRLTAMKGSTLG